MRNSPRFRGIIGLSMLLLLFGIYSLGHSIFSLPGSAHYAFIPEDATLVIEVHTEALFDQGAEDLLASREDSTLFRLINDKLGETKWSDLGSNGIDARADILFFSYEVDGNTLYGQLFLLEDEKKFRRNYLPELNEDSKCAVVKGRVALLLWQADPEFSPKKLKALSEKLINGPHRSLERKPENGLIQVHSFASKKSSAHTISCQIEDDKLTFTGEIIAPGGKHDLKDLRALKPDGFHLSTRFVPSQLEMLSGFDIPIPLTGITALSMNYRGTEINTDQSPQVMPNVDVFLHFEEAFDLEHFLDSLAQTSLITQLENGRFLCSGVAFYYRQIEATQIYIGRQTMGELQSLNRDEAFRISGPFADLARVKTSGLIGRFIEILPPYIATQELARNCENVELTGTFHGKEIKVEGSLGFKTDHYFTTELLRFLLLSKFM